MEQDLPQRVPTRRQYIEQLVDGALQDAHEMDEGFMKWVERHTEGWREQGRDESWIRQRIESAQTSHTLLKSFQSQGFTLGQQRKALREMYEAALPRRPDLYGLMLERLGLPAPEEIVHGTGDDLQGRHALRVQLYQIDQQMWKAFCLWSDDEVTEFEEYPGFAVIRDMSTVEELEISLHTCEYMLACFSECPKLSDEAIRSRMDTFNTQARAQFIADFGYAPEDSTVPFTPVTINGPVDHDDYMAVERQGDQKHIIFYK